MRYKTETTAATAATTLRNGRYVDRKLPCQAVVDVVEERR